MALIEMDFAMGKHYEETVLWENPNPYTTEYTGGIVTLNDEYTNYDYLKIVCYRGTSSDEFNEVIYKSEDFATFKYGNVNPAAQMGIIARTATSNASVFFYRDFTPASNNHITITNGYRNNTTTADSSVLIPYRIIGIKEDKNLGYMSYGEVNTEAIITSLTVNCDVGDYITMATASAWTSGTGSSGIGKDDITVQGGDILVSDIGTQSSWPNGSSYWYSKNRLLIVRATSTTVTFSVTSTSGQYKMLRPVWTVSKIV